MEVNTTILKAYPYIGDVLIQTQLAKELKEKFQFTGDDDVVLKSMNVRLMDSERVQAVASKSLHMKRNYCSWTRFS